MALGRPFSSCHGVARFGVLLRGFCLLLKGLIKLFPLRKDTGLARPWVWSAVAWGRSSSIRLNLLEVCLCLDTSLLVLFRVQALCRFYPLSWAFLFTSLCDGNKEPHQSSGMWLSHCSSPGGTATFPGGFPNRCTLGRHCLQGTHSGLADSWHWNEAFIGMAFQRNDVPGQQTLWTGVRLHSALRQRFINWEGDSAWFHEKWAVKWQ